MLRAFRLALAAGEASVGVLGLGEEEAVRAPGPGEVPVDDGLVVQLEIPRHIHAVRARHTVLALGARDRLEALVSRFGFQIEGAFRIGQAVRPAARGAREVLPHLLERAHSAEHRGHLGLIPRATAGLGPRGSWGTRTAPDLRHRWRQGLGKLAARSGRPLHGDATAAAIPMASGPHLIGDIHEIVWIWQTDHG